MQEHEKVNILLVDDQPAKLLSYEVILRELGENLIRANSAQEAFQHLLKTDIAVLLVDVCMPDLDGFQLAKMVRDHPRFQSTAIIAVSIPISLLITFAPLNLLGVSMNIMSLGGLVLGIGMRVDSSIVVPESISRCRE